MMKKRLEKSSCGEDKTTYGDDKADVDQADARERAARAHFESYDEDRR